MTIFDFTKQIIQKDDIKFFDNLDEQDKKIFSIFMIQRFLSMNKDWIWLINFVNKWTFTIDKEHYFKLITLLIPNQSKTYYKYIKGKNDIKYNIEVINCIINYFQVSKKEAIEYYNILSNDKKIELLKKYGYEEKKIKKILKELKKWKKE